MMLQAIKQRVQMRAQAKAKAFQGMIGGANSSLGRQRLFGTKHQDGFKRPMNKRHGKGLRQITTLMELEHNQAIKFPLQSKGHEFPLQNGKPSDGLVFLLEDEVHAYINVCEHRMKELDWDNDKEFFIPGKQGHPFLQCKVHGALFDPCSGICVELPKGCANVEPLVKLATRVDEEGNVFIDEALPPLDNAFSSEDSRIKCEEAYKELKADVAGEEARMEERRLRKLQKRMEMRDKKQKKDFADGVKASQEE